MQRREDGSEDVLAQLENPQDLLPQDLHLQIDHDHGVVVARVGNVVAIMKLVV